MRINNMRFKLSFAKKAFLIMAIGVIVPIYGMFLYINSSFSSYMDEEISSKVSQLIDGSEERIYSELENLVNASNMFFTDEDFWQIMNSEEADYYEKCQYFDSMVGYMTNSNLLDSRYIKLTYFDAWGQIYTNWSVNFNDYSFLRDKWMGDYQGKNGYLTWRFFEESPIKEEQGKDKYYISLVRYFGGNGEGILIISMDVELLNELLEEYHFSENDHIFICSSRDEVIVGSEFADENAEEIQGICGEIEDTTSGTFMKTIQNNKYIVHYYAILNYLRYGQEDFKVLALVDYQNVVEQTNHYMMRTWLFLIAFSIFLLLIIYVIIKIILKPVNNISEKLSTYSVNEDFTYDYAGEDEISRMYQAFSGMTKRINVLFARLNEESAIREKYRYESLRAQINPHFIFNTLNSIRWMAMIRKEDNIVKSIDSLTDILQYSMGKGGDEVTVRQELDSVTAYVAIQNLRYGGICRLISEIPEELYSCRMIKFSMQPIVENCFIHGFKEGGKEEWIRIAAYRDGDRLILEIENSGVPVSDEAIHQFENRKQGEHRDTRKVTGIGMHNVDEIIRITYGKEYGLRLEKRENRTVVQYILPFVQETKE